jgi:probable phosphoglycerate mutase
MGVDDGTGGRTPDQQLHTRLVAVRHGTTAWSVSRRHTGRSDIPLEPEGVDQAIEVGRRLAGNDFALVLTSPLERALATCELAGFGTTAQLSDDLVEWDYGEMEGRTTEQIRADIPGWDLWRDGVVGGETLSQVSSRADRVIARVRSQPGAVLVFAHAHILRIIAARWIGLQPEVGRAFSLEPATVSVLGWEREAPVVARWNDAVGNPSF